LEREHLQVEHQLGVLLKRRRYPLGLGNHRQIVVGLQFRFLNVSFDIANRVQILVKFGAIPRSKVSLQAAHLLADRIEQAPLGLQSRLHDIAIC
jgi:hypothetical protein